MELTYENMMGFIKNYFDTLPTLEGDVESERKLGEFLAPECTVRRSTGPDLKPEHVIIENREQRLKHLNSHADEYRAVVLYEPYPLYLAVDDRKKIVSAVLLEKFMHPVTREVYDQLALVVFFELKLDENNNIKIKRQISTSIGGALEFI